MIIYIKKHRYYEIYYEMKSVLPLSHAQSTLGSTIGTCYRLLSLLAILEPTGIHVFNLCTIKTKVNLQFEKFQIVIMKYKSRDVAMTYPW